MSAAVPPVYRCPGCLDTSPSATRCDRCELPMLGPEHAGVRVVVQRLDGGVSDWRAFLGVTLPLYLLFNGVTLLAFLRWSEHLAPLALVVTLVGSGLLTLAIVWGLAAQSRRSNRRAREQLLEWPAGLAAQPLGGLAPGARVRVRGRVVAADRVLTDEQGAPCVAQATPRDEGPLAPALVASMVDFFLEDEEGARVRVRAEDLHFVDEAGHHLPSVPVGATVEVVGTTRAVAAVLPGAASGYRDAGYAVELTGSGATPVLLRVLAPRPAASAPRVRVEVTGDAAESSPEAEEGPREREAPRRATRAE